MPASWKKIAPIIALTLGAGTLTGCVWEPAGYYGGDAYYQPAPVYVGPSYYYGPRYGGYYHGWRGGGGWHGGGGHWH